MLHGGGGKKERKKREGRREGWKGRREGGITE